jgi:hypothetical protein
MALSSELATTCPCCGRRTIKHESAEGQWFERRYYACGAVIARLSHVGWVTDEHGWMHNARCGDRLLPGLVHLITAH